MSINFGAIALGELIKTTLLRNVVTTFGNSYSEAALILLPYPKDLSFGVTC